MSTPGDASTHRPVPINELTTLVVAPVQPDAPEFLKEQRLLDGRYRLLEVRGGTGKSGMGVVYIVEDADRLFAVKTFQARFARDLALVQRFIREARTWMLLGFHQHIVRTYRVEIIDAVPYLFMEYVESDTQGRHSLSDYLKRGPLAVPEALQIALQICEGMSHATAAAPGLVHRDLKPENILMNPQGIAKITDFGLVRCGAEDTALERFARAGLSPEESVSLTQAGAIFGTPAYMAPEQFAAAGQVTGAADIYAFGCMLYEMLTGAPPFSSGGGTTVERIMALRRRHMSDHPPRLHELARDCPPEVEGIIVHCLEKDPDNRWPDFFALGNALRDALARLYGFEPAPIALPEVSAREVGEQMRSLTLLDGYDQAIRLRNLREHHTRSPYAFHLALASYFHFQHDKREEERQLVKALRARRTEPGNEVIRRLAELYLSQGRLAEAEQLLAETLALRADAMNHLLDPYVRMLLLQGRLDEATHLIERQPPSFRTDWLRTELYRQTGQNEARQQLLQRLLEDTLERLHEKLQTVAPDDEVAWGREGDASLLQDVLQTLRPAWDASVLDVTEEAIWPDLCGFPDFAPDMAWLSEWLGQLSKITGQLPQTTRETYADCAGALGYPQRLRELLDRDETWFWSQEARRGH